jgi:glycosyltransferase involved in cell wall biosynthesis
MREKLDFGNAPVIAFVGGFQLWHGLDLLVESFARVLTECPQAKLLLVGDGPAREVVEAQIAKFELGNSVVITGLIPQSQVPKMLAVADIAVIPYPELPQELWFSPLKLYEYMAAGKAIVASNAGQIAEVIQNGQNGLLVESGDVEGLGNAIVALIKNPIERERLGNNAKQQALEQHSWKQYIRRLEEIYLSVL